MFPQQFVTETLAKFPGSTLADAERISAWMSAKHAIKPFSNPHTMFEKLMDKAATENATAARFPVSVKPGRTEHPKPFVGFDASGSCFRSETPVTNPQTEFARWIVTELREQLLTPADVVRIARTRDREIWQAIGVHTLMHWNAHAHWTRDERNVPVECQRECDLSCWASLPASSGLAECIRSFGGWYPWANDRDAWAAMLARDASRRHAA